jgi:hypothetical protein
MGLEQQQNLLARLYTDADFRRAFLSEPEKIGAENDLSAEEIGEIAAIMPDELNFFADSLFWKRIREVEKFLPLTRNILGEDFIKYFREFSQAFNPQSVKKHFEDAREFCGFLEGAAVGDLTKTIAKFERAKLNFASQTRCLQIESFGFDVREILRQVADGKSLHENDFARRKTFAVWLRIGKMTKLYFI